MFVKDDKYHKIQNNSIWFSFIKCLTHFYSIFIVRLHTLFSSDILPL